MQKNGQMIASGTLDENGDTWFLVQPNNFLLLDAPFEVDERMRHKAVSAIGHMGIPESAPRITKLLVDRIVLQEAIAQRAFAIFQSGSHQSQEDRRKEEVCRKESSSGNGDHHLLKQKACPP